MQSTAGMTPHIEKVLPFLSTAFLLTAGAACIAEVPDEDVSVSQGELRCSGDCCGELNCRVPDAEKRRGCSGARIRNGATGECTWPLASDADRSIYDGMGTRMGEVRSDEVKLNQGIRKQRDGDWYVYAFNTTVRMTDGTLRPFSGWIRQSDLVHAGRLHGYTLALGDPGNGHYRTRWRITGGDVARYSRLHLVSPGGRRYPATDYLLRPYGLVHLTYTVPGFNLGGHATDSFQPGAIFRRSKGVRQIVIPLYGPRGYRSRYSLHFVYGYVHDGVQRRYGWIAKEALEEIETTSSGSGVGGEGSPCAARCCDGTVFLEIPASSAAECVSASSPVCRDHEYVLRARWEGSVTYERDRFCWAKCANRTAYHRVDGVTSGCTDHARAFCAAGDRGAFEDAIWDACQPM